MLKVTNIALKIHKNPKLAALLMLLPLIAIGFSVGISAASGHSLQEEKAGEAAAPNKALGFVAAAIAVMGSGLGAGIAVYGATSAGAGAIVERPETAVWILIFAGLGEGIAIYGLIIAIMILGKL